MVIATRELRSVVRDLEHVALAWCVRFAGQIISRTVKGAGGAHCVPTRFSAGIPSKSHAFALGEKMLYLEASKGKIQITDLFLNGIFLGIREGSQDFVAGAPAGCVVC